MGDSNSRSRERAAKPKKSQITEFYKGLADEGKLFEVNDFLSEEPEEKYICPRTGAHFKFADMCDRLNQVVMIRQIYEKKIKSLLYPKPAAKAQVKAPEAKLGKEERRGKSEDQKPGSSQVLIQQLPKQMMMSYDSRAKTKKKSEDHLQPKQLNKNKVIDSYN